MQTVFLTGFMGSGKTTIGQLLAKKLSLPVIDTDQYIEKKLHKSIREIFETEGEDKFRDYEHHFLRLMPTRDTIVTTGGGIILRNVNREWMKENGTVIYLHCNPEEIIKRLVGDNSRPLLDGDKQANILTIFAGRLAYYNEADYKIDTTKKTPNEIVEEIVVLIKKNYNGDTNH